jgi:small subunit ribosomal protein S16
MAVHIRLSRAGAKKRPFYRIVVTDQRSPRGGRFLENLGTFDPVADDGRFTINLERLTYWRRPARPPKWPSRKPSSFIARRSRRVESSRCP